jgi:trehalose-6-phosphate synthase
MMKRRMSHHTLNLAAAPQLPNANAAPDHKPVRQAFSRGSFLNYDCQSEHEWMEEEERRLTAQIEEITLRLQLMKAQQRTEEDDAKDEHISGFTGRLIMASNRLPVTITKKEDGTWDFSVSSGGLVTALSGLKQEIPFLWVGWVGLDVPKEEEESLAQQLQDQYGLYPVFLSAELVEKYYNGFCNDILWPLFHYTPLPMFQPGRDMKFDSSQWEAYKEANMLFAEVIGKAYQPGDIVWVHDYHLMMTPAMLRDLVPSVTLGWFLHTPFPASDVYRCLPMRIELLQGVMMADLLGFHTYDYSREYLNC